MARHIEFRRLKPSCKRETPEHSMFLIALNFVNEKSAKHPLYWHALSILDNYSEEYYPVDIYAANVDTSGGNDR